MFFFDGKDEKVINAPERLVTIYCQPQRIEVRHTLFYPGVGEDFVHDLCTPNRPNPCKTASTIVENWGIHHYIKPQNREND